MFFAKIDVAKFFPMKSREGMSFPPGEEPTPDSSSENPPNPASGSAAQNRPNVPLITRREFLHRLLNSTAALSAGMAFKLGVELYNKKELERKPGVPSFIYEKSSTNREKYIPNDIIQQVDKAKTILERVDVEYNTTPVPVKSPAQEPKPESTPKVKVKTGVALATMDLLEREPDIHTISVEPDDNEKGKVDDEGHIIEVGDTAMGVGTTYDVTVPEQHLVLATKQVITQSGKPEAVVYSPYSPDLDVPVVRFEGYTYLKNLLATAKTELNKIRIKSRIPNAREIAQDVPEDLALMLTLVEQIDPNIFERKSKNIMAQYKISQEKADVLAAKDMANKALTVVGLNRNVARKYARSNKGASGLFQLMPDTYKALRDKDHYPTAGLVEDFGDGSTEHFNASKAALLLLDSDLADARDQRKRLINNPKEMGKYLSAAYNAGSGAVRKAMEDYGSTWAQKMNNETTVYIRKFLAVNALFEDKIPDIPELETTGSDKTIVDRNRSGRRSENDIPESLAGGASAIAKENDKARVDSIEFIENMDRLAEMVKKGELVPLPNNEMIKFDPRLSADRRYCLPHVAKFLTEMAAASKKYNPNFEPLMINSAVRPKDVQAELRKRNPNAIAKSTHPTGATVDIAYNANPHYKGMSLTQIQWTERYLLQKEKQGLIQATEERKQTVFHVMVFKRADK